MQVDRIRFSETPLDDVPPRGFVDLYFDRDQGLFVVKDYTGAVQTVGAGGVSSDYLGVMLVDDLPTPTTELLGKRAFVTDLYVGLGAPQFYMNLTPGNSGGTEKVPVYCDGEYWRVG